MVPLTSFIESANIHEGKFLIPMIQKVRNELSFQVNIIVGDMGYISSAHKMELRKMNQIAVLTKVRENMSPPECYHDYKCPECPEGIPLSWDGYNPETEMHCYISPVDNQRCDLCRQSTDCYLEKYISPTVDEHHFGIIPLHTRVSQKLLKVIRPQVERGFENDKNKFHLNKFFINSLKLARIVGYLSDACQILRLLADMKTNSIAKAKRNMKNLQTQISFDFK